MLPIDRADADYSGHFQPRTETLASQAPKPFSSVMLRRSRETISGWVITLPSSIRSGPWPRAPLSAKDRAANKTEQHGEQDAFARLSDHDAHVATGYGNDVRQGRRMDANQKWIAGLHSHGLVKDLN